jgi:hypothetical protein
MAGLALAAAVKAAPSTPTRASFRLLLFKVAVSDLVCVYN